jgi:hypothetical protein
MLHGDGARVAEASGRDHLSVPSKKAAGSDDQASRFEPAVGKQEAPVHPNSKVRHHASMIFDGERSHAGDTYCQRAVAVADNHRERKQTDSNARPVVLRLIAMIASRSVGYAHRDQPSTKPYSEGAATHRVVAASLIEVVGTITIKITMTMPRVYLEPTKQ